MKTTHVVKHNLIVFRDLQLWESIRQLILDEYGASMLISWKCKRELGFTIRTHQGLVPYLEKWGQGSQQSPEFVKENQHRMAYEDQIHLDFYNASSLSWFVLKYLDT
jgi:hypothetical protein